MATNKENLHWLKTLYPGYFALTMSTGIISVGFDIIEMPKISDVVGYIAIFSWITFAVLYMMRLALFKNAFVSDLLNPKLTFNFFTFIAATCLIGLIFFIHKFYNISIAFWLISAVAWIALLYCSFGVLTIFHREKTVNIVDGRWLICIVGTEALVLLGVKIIDHVGTYAPLFVIGTYMLWGIGIMLYAIFVTLFSYRIFFLDMRAEDYTPQMWVVMGAAAICANAGSGLEMATPVIDALYEVHAVIEGVALLAWAWATWWIPLLVIIGFWRHFSKNIPITYDPRQWSIVFPLGMYTVASHQLSLAAEYAPLHEVSHVMIWITVFVWCLLIAALFRRILGRLFRPVRKIDVA